VQLKGQLAGCRLGRLRLNGSGRGIPEDGDTGELGDALLKQPQPLLGEIGHVQKGACDIATRPRQAGRVTLLHGITFKVDGDDRDGLRGLLRRLEGGWPSRENDRHRELDQLGCEGGEALGIPRGKALLNPEVLPRHIADVLQPVQECFPERSLCRPKAQNAYALVLRHLLGRSERHHEQA
jgi:hypothetical protein